MSAKLSAEKVENMLRWAGWAIWGERDLVSDRQRVGKSWKKLGGFGEKLGRFGSLLDVFGAFLRGDFHECAQTLIVRIAYFDRQKRVTSQTPRHQDAKMRRDFDHGFTWADTGFRRRFF